MASRVRWQLLHATAAASVTACAAVFALIPLVVGTVPAAQPATASGNAATGVGLQLVRSATVRIEYAGTVFLVDPMLAEAEAYPGIAGTHDAHLRYPRVGLPMSLEQAMEADAVVLTHLHPDHWDTVARERLPKSIPVFVQDEADARSVRADGFTDVRVFDDTVFRGTRLYRTGGQHGTDTHIQAAGEALGKVSGVVFQRDGYKSVYVAGDTTWHPEVEAAIARHRPDVIVLNAGDARIAGLDGSIIMGRDDLARARRAAPDAAIVAVHLEAVNHATQSRDDLHRYIRSQGLDATWTLVPEDGDAYRF
ncbi:MBL fold metallo-hydrolase [Luteimonas kalidii]|uniref:MBL fold metallo-hydrolase n=1 Tax=Luteimonas kalidii TaxID=3042025 RepID=A0ABT6JQD9_9GAMM|nr:MBL fold metallo-hydrolase [Luteimonas kalidii]MDH5832829.1 MBL fold metallo-hydrolase [Luteimonas kalidii]